MSSVVELSPADPGDQLVLSRYRPICRLGRGGQADVYLATTPGPADFHRLVVIKVLRERRGPSADGVAAFLEEAKLSARLNHPNVVQTLEVSEYRGRPCLVMEHLEGQSLERVRRAVHAGGRSSDALWARIMSDALAGLAYAHELADYERRPLRIVHRDISPQNIFLTYHGQVKILDFGIAQTAESPTSVADGVVRGKVNYMSPEQVGERTVDARTDVFAMGMVFWELLTGKRLIDGDGPSAVYKLLSDEDLPRVSDSHASVNPQLDDIVARALERDPSRRYQSAAAMRKAIETYLASVSDAPGADDIGQLLQNLFASQREDVRRRVREYMSAERREVTTDSYLLTLDSSRVPVLMSDPTPAPEPQAEDHGGSGRGFWLASMAIIGVLGGAAMWVASTGSWSDGDATSTPTPAVAAASEVRLESQPVGANVHVGTEFVGKTPLSVATPTETLTLEVSAPGFVTAIATVQPGEASNRLVVLTPTSDMPASAERKPDSETGLEPQASAEPDAPFPPTLPGQTERPADASEPPTVPTTPAPTVRPPTAPPPTPRAPSVKVIEEEKPKVRVIE